MFISNYNLYSCGNNTFGQSGFNGSPVSIPTLIPFNGNITQISAGQETSFFITDEAELYGFGYNGVMKTIN